MPKGTQQSKPKRGKNIKNIYVHKINSLMKISRDNIHQEDLQMMHKLQKSKMKRIHSEIDKGTLKLQKNRQSARKARQRKKLYIKLLQNQVEQLKDVAKNGQQIQKEGTQYLSFLHKKIHDSHYQHQMSTVDKYLSQSDMGQTRQSNAGQLKERVTKMDKYAEQMCQMYIPPFLKNIQTMREDPQGLNEIMVNENNTHQDYQELNGLVYQLILQQQNMRKKFGQLMRINQSMKKHVRQVAEDIKIQYSDQDFGFDDNTFNMSEGVDQFIKQENLCQIKRNQKEMFDNIVNKRNKTKIFVNVNQAQNLITKMEKFNDEAIIKSQY